MAVEGEIIKGSTVVGVERRINFLESIIINLAVSEDTGVNQYPIRIGSSTRNLSGGIVSEGIHISVIDGYALVSLARVGSFVIDLYDTISARVWRIIGSGAVTGPAFGVARDSSGNVYATGSGIDGGHIVKFNSSQVLQWQTLEWEIDPGPPPVMDELSTEPKGCVLTGDEAHIWVCDFHNTRMVKFATSDGSYVSEFELDNLDTLPEKPLHVDLDTDGNLYISDTLNNLVHKYNPSGTLLTFWGGDGTGDGEFSNMRGIAVATSRRSNNDVFVFVFDADTPTAPNARIQVFDGSGTFLWARDIDDLDTIFSDTGDVAIVWGAQTEWFYYPTEDQSQSVSAGAPDGGRVVPTLDFYDNQIIRANIIEDMHIVIEILAAAFINAGTGNTFNWTGSDADNLYHVAVEAGEYDWLRPRNADLEGETIRPDEITEIDLCLTKLEQSFIITV